MLRLRDRINSQSQSYGRRYYRPNWSHDLDMRIYEPNDHNNEEVGSDVESFNLSNLILDSEKSEQYIMQRINELRVGCKGNLLNTPSDRNGSYTPLHSAVKTGRSILFIEYLIKNSADPFVVHYELGTILHQALEYEDNKLFEFLARNYKKLLPIENASGKTVLEIALIKANYDATKYLLGLSQQEIIHAKYYHGNSALHLNMIHPNIEITKLLLDKAMQLGVLSDFLNLKNNSGNTALNLAMSIPRLEVAKLLYESGSDPTISNEEGQNAINIAFSKFGSTLDELLINKGPFIENNVIESNEEDSSEEAYIEDMDIEEIDIDGAENTEEIIILPLPGDFVLLLIGDDDATDTELSGDEWREYYYSDSDSE